VAHDQLGERWKAEEHFQKAIDLANGGYVHRPAYTAQLRDARWDTDRLPLPHTREICELSQSCGLRSVQGTLCGGRKPKADS
jgi:hypothetical protein